MAKHFTRNIRNTKCIGKDIEPLETNEQNDLLNQKPDVYVRNENYYHCLTNAIQKIDSLTDYIDVIKKENSNPVKDKVKVEVSAKKLEKELEQIQRDLSNIYNIEIAGLKKAIEELNETIKNLDGGNSEELKKKISELEDKIDEGLKELKDELLLLKSEVETNQENISKEIESIKKDMENIEGGGGGGVRSSTIVIANYDSHENSKKSADIVIGKEDNASSIINDVIESLGSKGGVIKFMEGNYNITDTIISSGYDTLILEGIPNATRFMTFIQEGNYSRPLQLQLNGSTVYGIEFVLNGIPPNGGGTSIELKYGIIDSCTFSGITLDEYKSINSIKSGLVCNSFIETNSYFSNSTIVKNNVFSYSWPTLKKDYEGIFVFNILDEVSIDNNSKPEALVQGNIEKK